MGGDAGATGPESRPSAGTAARRPWQGRRVVLGVTGGIAAYKVVQLARDLTRLGAVVDTIMTPSARQFVGPISFEAVTGRPVLDDILAPGSALAHIRLAREADVVCVAPATADFIARAAAGRSNDLLTATLLATRAPVLVCPAMNDGMWSHAQTRANVARLQEFGYRIAGPATGPLAFGEGEGPGRLEDPAVLVEHVGRSLAVEPAWDGRRVVVTAGPTREPMDAVRAITNRSSGRMGFAIAAAAWRRGADVLLIAGPTSVSPPSGPALQRVETAAEMAAAVRTALADADVLVMAAAVADFRPADVAAGKMKKQESPVSMRLEPTDDILRVTRDARRSGAVMVGFALETDAGLANARSKLESKGLDMIVLNPATQADAGFDVATNRVVLLDSKDGEEALPLLSKDEVAEVLLDRIAPRLGNGH